MDNIILVALFCTIVLILIIFVIGRLIDILTQLIVMGLSKLMGGKVARFIANWLTFIGVIHHELAHALFALITGAKVTKVSLFKPKGNSLGSVEMAPRGNKLMQSLQCTLSAIAPMVLGTVTEFILFYVVKNKELSLGVTILLIYCMISILIHMTMSWADIKSAVKGLPLCIVLLIVVWIVILFFGKGPFIDMIYGSYDTFTGIWK